MNSKGIISALKSDGWVQVAQKGSHVQFKHPTKLGRVTVPHPSSDVPNGTFKSIEKQADLKLKSRCQCGLLCSSRGGIENATVLISP